MRPFLCALLFAAAARGAGWPPVLDANNPVTVSNDGRKIERFIHGPRDSWGYPATSGTEWGYPAPRESGLQQQNHDSFYVVSPKEPHPGAPLWVVLHSANRTAYDYLGFACFGTKADAIGKPGESITNPPPDFYGLFLNSTNGEWWGGAQMRSRAGSVNDSVTRPPAERRVLDTIDWVADRYHVDRDRIYLTGVSMGGCGTLGIGMPNGDVFAAIRAGVPAGTYYANNRMGGFAPIPAWDATEEARQAWMKRAAAVGHPDPPVIVDFSSEADTWSATQPGLVTAAQAGRLPLVLGWGMFGHVGSLSVIARAPIDAVVLAFPWDQIRRNEAYPVFTHASCDNHCPWLNGPAEYDGAGQINAWFRWKNETDTPAGVAMQLWLAQSPIPNAPGIPRNATADVTLRRLQQFKIEPGRSYAWQVSRNGSVIASGTATPDSANLLTIPGVSLSGTPEELSVR